jgi:4-hydroxy-4-methyl-2-oxoglutarate aldolase
MRDAKALELVETLRRVGYSAVVSDCCDQVGLREQTMTAGIRPVSDGTEVLIGFARPVRSMAVEAAPDTPYGAEIEFIDSLRTDDVVVATVEAPSAFWGELFSTAARARGSVGAIIDGLVRDQARIRELGFPLFARGGRPTDSLGRISIVEHDVSMRIAGVMVAPGDLIVADIDGVTVVPVDAIEEVATRAIEKATTENRARELLEGGALLRNTWDRFKVL